MYSIFIIIIIIIIIVIIIIIIIIIISEIRGFLRKKVHIQTSPTVAPLIFVASATYGITPTGKRDRLDVISRKIKEIEAVEHKRRQGLILTPEEVIFIKNKKM